MAIGALIDIEPLIEQGALQKVVTCECGEAKLIEEKLLGVLSQNAGLV